MKAYKPVFFTSLLILCSCSTLNDSLRLGGSLGAMGGAAATYAGYRAGGVSPSLNEVALGSSVGAVVGLLTSYFIHSKNEELSIAKEAQTEMQFGDLPPSPFVFPQPNRKKGER